ncbi:hypothetical protein PINS_up020318 [Pythium insidiosum]|nr:hypothetical protein PINS_up020318 [Pythium insidiosum]
MLTQHALSAPSIEINVRDMMTKTRPIKSHDTETFGASIACVLSMFFEQNNLCLDGTTTEALATAPSCTMAEEPTQSSVASPSLSIHTQRRKRVRVQRGNSGDGEDRVEKRRKHREVMVQFRLKKKQQLETMKAQEQRLQDELQAALQAYHAHRQARSDLTAQLSRHEQLMDQFACVLSRKESLLRGNRALEQHISEQIKFERVVAFELERVTAASHHAMVLEDRRPGAQPKTKDASRDSIPQSIRAEIESHQIFLPKPR